MKKLIAILVVFAIMVPALFAQDAGTWSLGSKGQIGTRLDFLPWELRSPDNENSDQPAIMVGATSYEAHHNVGGTFNVTYRKGGIETGLDFDQNGSIIGFVGFNNGIGSFRAATSASNLFNGASVVNVDKLYGGFNLLDGIIDLQIAVKSNWRHDLWVSSTLLGDTYSIVQEGNFLSLNVKPIDGFSVGFILPGIFDAGLSGWANNNAHTQQDLFTSIANVQNRIVSTDYAQLRSGAYRRFIQDSVERMTFGLKYGTGPFNAAVQYGLRGRPQFYDDENNIRDVSMLNSVVYLGIEYNLTSAMNIQLAAKGEFFKSFDDGTRTDGSPTVDLREIDPTNPNAIPAGQPGAGRVPGTRQTGLIESQFEDVSRTAMAIGGRFRYTDGPLQAYLGVFYFNDVWTAGGTIVGGEMISTALGGRGIEGGILRLRPFFRYDIVPEYLRFRIDTKIDLPLSDWYLARYDNYDTDVKNEWLEDTDNRRGRASVANNDNIKAWSMAYEFVPEVFFNVMGTGATDGVNMDNNFTGIAARYRVAGTMFTGELWNKRASHPTRNAFDIIFRWTF
jgi:hypothetical protein